MKLTALQWTLILQPLIVIAVPLLLIKVREWLGDKYAYITPILAPILGTLIDQVQGFVSGNTLGPAWGAALGLAGVGLREVLKHWTSENSVKSFLFLLLLPGLLTSCATSDQAKIGKTLDVTGTSLEVAGKQFVEIGAFFNQALDAKLITNDQYRTWAAFAKKFKQGFPPAVSAYKVAVSAGNLASAQEIEKSIQPLISELAQFAVQVYRVLNKPTAWVLPERPTDIVASLPEKGGGQRMTLVPQLDPVALLILYSVGTPTPAVAR